MPYPNFQLVTYIRHPHKYTCRHICTHTHTMYVATYVIMHNSYLKVVAREDRREKSAIFAIYYSNNSRNVPGVL